MKCALIPVYSVIWLCKWVGLVAIWININLGFPCCLLEWCYVYKTALLERLVRHGLIFI